VTDAPDFEWDDTKATANLTKHGVPFPTPPASCSPRAVQKLAASRPEDGETRAKLVGAIEGRIFAPVITRRGGLMRLISARRANTRETRAYGPL